ncbi:MAG: cytochrome c biogenesis protein CcsA [Prevotella sp.]|nr:cytochrome c biogenesis protein CcsA [Prevotella sp.]
MRLLKYAVYICFLLVVIMLAATSLLDALTGREGLSAAVYGSWAFAAVWAVLALLAVAYLIRCKIWQRPAVALLHAALIIILLGGLATRISGERGTLHIRSERPVNLFLTAENDVRVMPFDVQLDSFFVSYYPGTNAPSDYTTRVKIVDGGKRFSGTASMNRPLAHRGYRLYQADYDRDLRGSVLLVAHDELGVGITYAGYILLLAAIIAYPFDKKGRFRQLLNARKADPARKRKARRRAIVVTGLTVTAAAWLTLTIILARHTIVLHRPPLADGVEAMRALAWASLSLSLLLFRRNAMILVAGLVAAALALLTAALTGGGSSSMPLIPVLRSPLLTVHVAVIIAAYALLLFIFFNSAAGVALTLMKKDNDLKIRQLRLTSETLLFPALFLLAIGIFLGAVWANISWGRYWGWDAKETWALITLMVYALPVHRRVAWFDADKHFNLYCAAAFLAVLMTYFGANYFLAGLHSYA